MIHQNRIAKIQQKGFILVNRVFIVSLVDANVSFIIKKVRQQKKKEKRQLTQLKIKEISILVAIMEDIKAHMKFLNPKADYGSIEDCTTGWSAGRKTNSRREPRKDI